ncbi:MAG TPA: hypothetical protein VHC39_02545 [Rhizomicrobium sp.]|nr:hypothetical protein [Rhizomicrobium sp.]
MKQFELRFLDLSEAVIRMRSYAGHDDLAALREAEKQSATHVVEVWEGNRKVARVKKDNAALTAMDRFGG